MSYEDRDWIREPEPRGWSFRGLPPILTIITATTAAFIVQSAVANGSSAGEIFIDEHLALNRRGVLGGEIWQPLTYLLLHGDLGHLFWNMVGLWAFGTILRNHVRDRTFWLTYLAGGLAGAAACLFSAGPPVVGASGAVTAVLVAAALRAPRTPIYAFLLPLPIPLWLLGVIYVALDLLAAFQMWMGGQRGMVAVQAHLGGAVIAAVLFAVARRRPAGPRRSRREAFEEENVLRPAGPPPVDTDRVDALLERIHASGMGSLSDEEKEFLKRASERYRGRKT
jgi:membrane associated rhomboid family serine protease